MPRATETATRASGAFVSEDLRTHAAERSNILASLTASLKRDQRVRCAWLWGSFLRGEEDDLSDLDIWLLVPPECVDGLGGAMKGCCEAAGTVVCCGENSHNAPEDGGYFSALLTGSHGLHQLDIYWQPVSVGTVPDAPVLVDRRGEAWPPFESRPESPQEEQSSLAECAGKIAFVWLMLSVAAKYLARDPGSDMALLLYPKNAFEETVSLLGLGADVGSVEWAAPEAPLAKVDLLRHVAAKTLILENAARTRGLVISPEANPCLVRYFDLVEGILRATLVN